MKMSRPLRSFCQENRSRVNSSRCRSQRAICVDRRVISSFCSMRRVLFVSGDILGNINKRCI